MNKQIHKPLISVVMPVYNAEAFLAQAIDSILTQSYKNIEFIIIDDASTDNSWKILKDYASKYPQIKLIRNKWNEKQARAVTRAMDMARGDFIARMDADDIAFPHRLEMQVRYLQRHRKTVAVGGQCVLIDKDGNVTGEKRFPTKFDDIYEYSFKFCPVQQPSLMIAKKRLPEDFEYYDHDLAPVEDAELVYKLMKHGKLENLPYYLLMYRIHGENSSLKNYKKSFFLTLISRVHAVTRHGYVPTPEGVLFTLAQSLVVFCLPQEVTSAIYRTVKRISIHRPTPAYSLPPMTFRLEKVLA